MTDRVGQQFGNYRLVSLLGQGGYAEVYLGHHVRLELQAAIKVLHAHLADKEAEHFQQEAQTIAKLAHPAIVRVFDFDVQDGMPFLVMDYAPNGSLRRRYPKGTVVPLPQILSSVKQVAAGLQYAHERKFIHRDVKPENMLVGRHEEVLLSDFGLAALAHSSASLSTQEAIGTLPYMAPEQIEGNPRAASDQYALGVVVYEWLCGSRPFEGSATEVVVQQLTMPPPPLHEKVATIPLGIEQVVLRALAKDPKERFASVAAFATALEQESFAALLPSAPSLPSSSASPMYSTVAALPSQANFATEAMVQTGHLVGEATPLESAVSEPQTERPWNVPFGRNLFFTGRGQLLERLHEQLSRSHNAALNQSYALSGLGGIGKTQTAIEYAYRYRQEYSAVFWVRAASRETLVADYVALARLLCLPGQDAPDQMLIVVAVKRWLEQQEGWLLILDNADELPLLADLLPGGGQGHLLLTTRAQATGKIARSLSVEKMEPSEGMQLLLRRAKLLDPEETLDNVAGAMRRAAQQLVEQLDGLPLALDQAGAYIEETGCSLSEYLKLYAQHRLALLQQQSSMSTDYPHTVASTWALSFQQVEQQGPAAADLLRLCAFLHPDAIPEAMVIEGAAELGPVLSPVAADPLLLNAAIQALRRYSLVKRDPEARLLNIHRLVQVVLKESLDQAGQQQWAERSVRAVNRAFPEVQFASWERCELCLPHALLCAQWIAQHGFTFPEAARLLHAMGLYLRDRGQYTQAEPFLEQALSLRKQVLGPAHPETASTLNALAWLYVRRGKYQQAQRLVQPALAAFEHVPESEHPAVAEALMMLGLVYLYEGKYEQAEPLLQRALAMREQALGTSHSLVADSLHNLAVLYDDRGQYAKAEPLYQRALALYENAWGYEHPKTLTTLSNLASLYIKQGKYAQAEPLLQQALAIRARVLGPEHPDTAVSLQLLGRLYALQGKYAQAEPFLQRALAIEKQVLGPESDLTMRVLLYLAQLFQATGQEAQAESLYQQALASFERLLGSEHPRVAETLIGLAQLYTRQGHFEHAESLLERALSIDEHVLGLEQPQTATVLDAQGYLALLQGREEQAERLLQHAFTVQEQALGKAHPDVAHTLHHLAQLYENQGKDGQAHSLYQQALSIREQALGPDHPDTVATRNALIKRL
jgi:serine/threonine protein kinase/Tfp pilus assembly protein PilF